MNVAKLRAIPDPDPVITTTNEARYLGLKNIQFGGALWAKHDRTRDREAAPSKKKVKHQQLRAKQTAAENDVLEQIGNMNINKPL